jgi:hypothetical protein
LFPGGNHISKLTEIHHRLSDFSDIQIFPTIKTPSHRGLQDLAAVLEKRDMIQKDRFAAFKKELIGIINTELKTPVKDIYFGKANLY